MTYAQKLRDPRWQKKRLHILERDDWTCQSCRLTENPLQVHHLFYAKLEPWEYDDDCYQTLCEKCHKERQKIADDLANALKVSLKNVPTDQMAKFAERLIKNSQDTDPFRQHVVSSMNAAFDYADEQDAPLHFGLISDLVMSLYYCNIHKSGAAARTAQRLMGMAGDKLEGIK